MTELCELLRSTRFVSIVASGGMGKTTVAIAAAHALAPEFSNDCCFVDLAAVGEGALVPVTVASALGCYGQGENPLPGLLAFLAGRIARKEYASPSSPTEGLITAGGK